MSTAHTGFTGPHKTHLHYGTNLLQTRVVWRAFPHHPLLDWFGGRLLLRPQCLYLQLHSRLLQRMLGGWLLPRGGDLVDGYGALSR